MANAKIKQLLPSLLRNKSPLSLGQIQGILPEFIAERTLRRWLGELVTSGLLVKIGEKRGTKYTLSNKETPIPGFASNFNGYQQEAVLKGVRDLWSHTSTAIEGNTLSLKETHCILEEGLTISGKSISEHQEIIGHAKAIDLIYQAVNFPISDNLCFDLHKAVQTEKVFDIDKPYGAWKVVINGTYIVIDDKPMHFEYAHPRYVPLLMSQIIDAMNNEEIVTRQTAPKVFAKYHAAIAHVHPFWDGNGRIARLLANIPLLKSNLLPLLIPNAERFLYKQILGKYELAVGSLTDRTGPWPNIALLRELEEFCEECYLKNEEQFRDYKISD